MYKVSSSNLKKPGILAIPALLLLLFLSACQENQAQWRGPDRNGIYPENHLSDKWPENGPEQLWKYEGIGRGYGSPVITGKKVYVNGEQNGNSFLFAFDLKGNLLWKAPNGKEFLGSGFSATYPGTRSAPTVVGDHVYATSGLGRIACFDNETGEEIWSVNIITDLEGMLGEFGYSESVVVDKTKVYCFPGGNKINMAALDRNTGNIIWTTEALRDTFSYCSPIQVSLPSRDVLITSSRHNLYAVDCKNGQLLGTYGLVGYQYEGDHCNSPVYTNGYIYFISADQNCKGTMKLQLSDDGKQIREIWYNEKVKNNFGGFVNVNNRIFTTLRGNWLKAIDLENGEVVDSLKTADGSLIYADNKFICYGRNGTVSLIEYSQNNLQTAGEFKIDEGSGHHFSHPVIADGRLYIRHGNALMSYNIKKN